MAGPEQADNTDVWRHLSDTIVSYAVTPKFSVLGNFDYGSDEVEGESVSWKGIAIGARGQVTDVFALSPRFEWYDDSDGFTTTADQTVKEFTITAEGKHPKGLIFRAEFRRDWSDVDFFADKDGTLVDGQNTFTIGVVYAFSTKTP
jgi:hypothetical protein